MLHAGVGSIQRPENVAEEYADRLDLIRGQAFYRSGDRGVSGIDPYWGWSVFGAVAPGPEDDDDQDSDLHHDADQVVGRRVTAQSLAFLDA